MRLDEWESVATHRELRAKYENRWPAMRRRFRVEGSRAGNSRLASFAICDRDAARYGGRVVEVIRLIPLEERQASPMPACPRCKAPAGRPCVSRNDKTRVPHSGRWTLYHEGGS